MSLSPVPHAPFPVGDALSSGHPRPSTAIIEATFESLFNRRDERRVNRSIALERRNSPLTTQTAL
jgi:hypothetical protein